jgi:hypothetical protein
MLPRRAILPVWSACLIWLPLAAIGQDPAPDAPPAPKPAAARRVARPISYGALPPQHNSVLRIKPWHEDFVPDDQRQYGYRNPGGVGRMAEYYPPNNQFQNDSPRHVTARIGLGGQPDRNEQLRAQAVGTAYYGMLQQHIDAYGSPRFGFGFGFGW